MTHSITFNIQDSSFKGNASLDLDEKELFTQRIFQKLINKILTSIYIHLNAPFFSEKHIFYRHYDAYSLTKYMKEKDVFPDNNN